jgi:sarcosine oxidase
VARQGLVTPPRARPSARTRARAEFVVIGGGVTGLAAAWALTRRGREVTVLEGVRPGHLGSGSHGTCRIFRFGYNEPAYVTLAGRARQVWAELEGESGTELLRPTPQLTFGPQMPEVRAAMLAAGAACELLSPDEAAARFPCVRATGEALLESESAVIAADLAMASLAARAGEIRTGARVTGLADDGRRVRVSTSAGDIDAAAVIVCAGPWTPGLLATAGIVVPGSATLEQIAYVGPADGAQPAAMPIFVHYSAEFQYGLPVPGTQQYKVGLHHSGPQVDPDHQEQADDPGLNRRIEQAVRTFLPGFDPRPTAVERCIYDNSPDADFIVDRVGNIVVGSGTSGHGFKFGPLLGEWLAALALDTADGCRSATVDAIPDRFALSRF